MYKLTAAKCFLSKLLNVAKADICICVPLKQQYWHYQQLHKQVTKWSQI